MINSPFLLGVGRNPLVYSLYNIINFTSEIPPPEDNDFIVFDGGDQAITDGGDFYVTDAG